MWTQARILKVGGAVTGAIGLIALPDDIGTWWDRIKDVISAVNDNPLAGVAILIGGILLTLGYRDAISAPFRNPKARWATDSDLGNEIFDWFRQVGFGLQENDKIPDTAFCFDATEPTTKRALTILKLKNEPDVRLQGRVVISPEHVAAYDSLTGRQRLNLAGDVAVDLARLGVGFSGDQVRDLGYFIVTGIIPTETLTSEQFMGRVNLMHRAILIAQVSMNRYLVQEGESPSSSAAAEVV